MRFLLLLKRIVYAALALVCPAAAVYWALLARADWLRSDPSPQHVAAAIRLDPLNGYGHTLQAEQLENDGRQKEAEAAWERAVSVDPRDAESWIRLGLLQENRGLIADAEGSFLRAAAVSNTWYPRWAMVNFYLRHERTADARKWARLALERGSDDVVGLFGMLDRGGIGIEELLPRNRRVLAKYIEYRLRTPDGGVPEQAARALAGLIPDAPATWPGAEPPGWARRGDPCNSWERTLLFAVADRLLDAGDGRGAVAYWNELAARKIVPEQWNAALPVVNGRFRNAPGGGGLDWRLASVPGVEIRADPDSGEVAVSLDGHQPQGADLVMERVFLPAGVPFRVAVESRTAGLGGQNGLEWQVRDVRGVPLASVPVRPSDEWMRSGGAVAAAAEDRVVQLVLLYRRVVGTVRAEGSARFRFAIMERSH